MFWSPGGIFGTLVGLNSGVWSFHGESQWKVRLQSPNPPETGRVPKIPPGRRSYYDSDYCFQRESICIISWRGPYNTTTRSWWGLLEWRRPGISHAYYRGEGEVKNYGSCSKHQEDSSLFCIIFGQVSWQQEVPKSVLRCHKASA